MADILGQVTGNFITYSIFGSFSSVNFLNKWIFTINPVKEPFFTLKDSHFFVAGFSVVTLVIIMLFVAEEHMERASFCDVLKILPKFE